MASLTEDTLADKVTRFVVGALLGALGGWFLGGRTPVVDDAAFVRLIVGAAGITGLLAVVFGNSFIERFIRGRWWE